MQLIIKPTNRCNMCCTFCSIANLDIVHSTKVSEEYKEIIKILKPDNIIITGGDPLCCEPEYYFELQNIANCNISLTTNMKEFYLETEKWLPLFKNENFLMCTSFNYGDARQWDKDIPFTEEMFLEVYELHKYHTGRDLQFIAVIDEYNEHLALEHVYLAKKLGTQVRLNNAIALGKQSKNYPRYKMFQIYLEIINRGLDQYEINSADRKIGRCPFNTKLSCQSTIRCVYTDSNGKIHYNSCEDELVKGVEIPIDISRPVYEAIDIPLSDVIEKECIYCELFRLCNGCASHRRQAKTIPEHCSEMKKLKGQIIESGWCI